MRVLVSDGEQRSTLAVTRSLGRAGHDVFVASTSGDSLAAASRHCRGEVVLPAARGGAAEALAELAAAAGRLKVDLFIPMTDASAELGLALRENTPGVQVLFPDAEAYRRISDKQHLLETAGGLGVPVPVQRVLEAPVQDPHSLERDAAEVPFPLVIKPARSAVATSGGVEQFGVTMVNHAASLAPALAQYPDTAYPLLLQQRIEGPGLGAFALFWDGRPVRWFAHRRIREKPPSGGVSVYRESVALRPDLREYATRILEHFKWRGVAMVEFKEDAATGTPYLMEVNGRFWGSLQLAIDAGVDFPSDLVSLSAGAWIRPGDEYRVGVRTRWLLGDLDHLIWILRTPAGTRRAYPELPSRPGAVARFLLDRHSEDRFEVFSLEDRGPFLQEVRQWIRSLGGGR